MQQEIEAKFLGQDHDIIRNRLKELGGTCKHKMKVMRRTVFDYPERRLQKEHAWVRLREELDGTVELVLKQVTGDKIGKTFEQPVIVNNYEKAKRFVVSLGLEVKGEQESKREVWRLGECEIMLDEWPWVKPFIEIEADSENVVREVAKKLDLDWASAKFGGVTPVYTSEYDLTAEEFESTDLSMKFDQPVPGVLRARSF